MIIAVEGPDHCGKSTMIERIAHFLDQRGISYIKLYSIDRKDKKVVQFLKNYNNINPIVREYRFNAFRQQLQSKIGAAVKQRKVVLLDRYSLSGIVYAKIELGESAEWSNILKAELKLIQPNLYIVMTESYHESEDPNTVEAPEKMDTAADLRFHAKHMKKIANAYFEELHRKFKNTMELKIDKTSPISYVHAEEQIICKLESMI